MSQKSAHVFLLPYKMNKKTPMNFTVLYRLLNSLFRYLLRILWYNTRLYSRKLTFKSFHLISNGIKHSLHSALQIDLRGL